MSGRCQHEKLPGRPAPQRCILNEDHMGAHAYRALTLAEANANLLYELDRTLGLSRMVAWLNRRRFLQWLGKRRP